VDTWYETFKGDGIKHIIPPPTWWISIRQPKNHIRGKVLLVTFNHFGLDFFSILGKNSDFFFFSLKCVFLAIIYQFYKIQKFGKKIIGHNYIGEVKIFKKKLHIFLLNAIFNYLLFHWIINKIFPFSNAIQHN
jgi:hypothetical protein